MRIVKDPCLIDIGLTTPHTRAVGEHIKFNNRRTKKEILMIVLWVCNTEFFI